MGVLQQAHDRITLVGVGEHGRLVWDDDGDLFWFLDWTNAGIWFYEEDGRLNAAQWPDPWRFGLSMACAENLVAVDNSMDGFLLDQLAILDPCAPEWIRGWGAPLGSLPSDYDDDEDEAA